jgi:hypothetical protein
LVKNLKKISFLFIFKDFKQNYEQRFFWHELKKEQRFYLKKNNSIDLHSPPFKKMLKKSLEFILFG